MIPNDRALLEAHRQWLGYVQPVGLLVTPGVLLGRGVVPDRAVLPQQQVLAGLLDPDEDGQARLADSSGLLFDLLGWRPEDLAGAPSGPRLPDELSVPLLDYGETLAPTYALRDTTNEAAPWLLLVGVAPEGQSLDKVPPDAGRGWAASPHARFERLLRETGVPIGLLTDGRSVRLIYAPRGESAGHATFVLGEMAEVAGRPILSAFLMLLHERTLFGAPEQALPRLLAETRQAQAAVSTKLARQVLGALHELLRGLDAADARSGRGRFREWVRDHPGNVYEGLLTALMRLVFILYAEDRGLFPGGDVWQRSYSLTGLFARLREDEARYPDTMDDRFGAWAQIVALWRLIHGGGGHGPELRLVARRGRLFDPNRFLFLEGRYDGEATPDPPPVSDGTVWRILSRLLVLDGERLSYRALDVEQIGSVYETMMGFRVELTEQHGLAVRSQAGDGVSTVVDLDALLAEPPERRVEWLRVRAERKLADRAAREVRAAASRDELAAALAGVQDRDATPAVVPPGAPVLQPTAERRRTGSHYTPRALTEPIVRQALEPVLAALGPSPTPEQVLDLKVLDPAMGSGAFLVEACRQLGDALVTAWAAHGGPPALPPDEDAVLHARRLVAPRSLYGVDRNPMAVDLARLSIWLVTLARDHEFTFVDHALRAGDSLVGLMREELQSLDWTPARQARLGGEMVRERLDRAAELRARIQGAADGAGEVELSRLLREAEAATRQVKLIGDGLIGAFFAGEKAAERAENREAVREAVEQAPRAVAGRGRRPAPRRARALRAPRAARRRAPDQAVPLGRRVPRGLPAAAAGVRRRSRQPAVCRQNDALGQQPSRLLRVAPDGPPRYARRHRPGRTLRPAGLPGAARTRHARPDRHEHDRPG